MSENLKLSSAIASVNRLASVDRRTDLVNAGRLLVLEKAGRDHNEARLRANAGIVDFGSVFTRNAEFQSAAEKWCDDVLYFCAEKVAGFSSVTPDRTRRDTYTRRELSANPLYLNALGGIIGDVINSITPAMVSDIMGEMASVVMVPRGRTMEISVNSNDVFKWVDTTWTSLRSAPSNQLYQNCITLNPHPTECKFNVNWYQMTSGGIGLLENVSAVAEGYASKLMSAFTTAFMKAASNSKYVPAGLKASSYTDDNWALLVQAVALANHTRRSNVIGYGTFPALRKVLPDNASLASAIMTPMGLKYYRDGYLQTHDGVTLFELQQAVDPDTINTTFTGVFPDDTIILAARASDRYAPMVMGFEEGSETSVNLTPGDNVIANGYIEGIAVSSLDIEPVFASRIGIMSNVA